MNSSTAVGNRAGTEAGWKGTAMTGEREIREALQGVADKVRISRDGMVTAKRMYFYHHGQTAEGFTRDVQSAMTSIGRGERVRVMRSEDHFNAWPKDSFFLTEFFFEMAS